MNWNNLNDFLAMGGYGSYVWGSFGVVAAALALEVLALQRRMARARAVARRSARRKERA